MDSDSGGRWLHYDEAASVLGITKASVRQKCIRGKLRRMHGNDGRSLVLVPGTASGTASNDVSDGVSNRVDTPLRTPSVQVTLAAALDELKAQLSAAAKRETRLTAQLAAAEARAMQEAEKAGKAIAAFASLAERLDALAEERRRPWWRRLVENM